MSLLKNRFIHGLAAAALVIGSTAQAVPPASDVDVMRLNLNLTVYTDGQGGNKKQVTLGSAQLVNLATGQALNAPAQSNLVLGMTCETEPRVVVFDTAQPSPQTDPVVLGTVEVIDEVQGNPFTMKLYRLVLDPNPATDTSDPAATPPANGIDDGELQMVMRIQGAGNGNGQACPKTAHFTSISGHISYHSSDAKTGAPAADTHGIVVRGVANLTPPVLGQVSPAPVVTTE
jgi:hypothetical protein